MKPILFEANPVFDELAEHRRPAQFRVAARAHNRAEGIEIGAWAFCPIDECDVLH